MNTPANVLIFFPSQRGKRLLEFEGFLFGMHRAGTPDGVSTWRCKELHCTSQLRVHNGLDILVEGSHAPYHNHIPRSGKTTRIKALALIKSQAETSDITPKRLVETVAQHLGTGIFEHLPKYTSIARNIQRKRRAILAENSTLPAAPETAQDVTMEGIFVRTRRGDDFLLLDTGTDDRVIMLATNANLRVLFESRHWMADGTLSAVPKLWSQLYTIHAVVHDAIVPVVYILLREKSESVYKTVCQTLLQKIRTLNPDYGEFQGPDTMTCDFEPAFIEVFPSIFTNSAMQGSLFHLGQAIHRQLQSLGLWQKYIKDLSFRAQSKMLFALAYVPETDVITSWERMQTMPGRAFAVESPLNQYFFDTFIGSRDGFSTPLFKHSFWNCRQRDLASDRRLSNSLESWHKALQRTINPYQPFLETFCGKILDEQEAQEMRLARLCSGGVTEKERKSQTIVTSRLAALTGQYVAMDRLVFLAEAACNLEMSN